MYTVGPTTASRALRSRTFVDHPNQQRNHRVSAYAACGWRAVAGFSTPKRPRPLQRRADTRGGSHKGTAYPVPEPSAGELRSPSLQRSPLLTLGPPGRRHLAPQGPRFRRHRVQASAPQPVPASPWSGSTRSRVCPLGARTHAPLF